MNNSFNFNSWKYFKLVGDDGLFDYEHGTRITASDSEVGGLPLITAGENNNGINRFIKKPEKNILYKNCITIDMFGNSFFHNYDFVCDDNIYPIFPKDKKELGFSNIYIAIFISCVINFSRKGLNSYGYQFREKTLKNLKIKLPAISNHGICLPDWKYMEEYIKEKYDFQLKNITTEIKENKNLPLNIKFWKTFKVGDVLDRVKLQKYASIPDSNGSIPVVSCSSLNQGVAGFCGENSYIKNAITVSTNGECFDSFYHDYDFVTTTDVEVLTSNKLNKYNAIFICTVLNQEKPKWGYGRKPKNNKVLETKIKLPCDNNGSPDWKYMENYIKNLPYGDKI